MIKSSQKIDDLNETLEKQREELRQVYLHKDQLKDQVEQMHEFYNQENARLIFENQ